MSATPPLHSICTRRSLLAGATATLLLCPFRGATASVGDLRRINLYNPRTDERLDAIYYVHGEYVPGVMNEINRILRDVRTDEMTVIDRRLVDIVSATQYLIGQDRPFSVISGYRSQRTNDMLRRRSSGVAKKSYHIKGMAADLRMKGVSTEQIGNIGQALSSGGVGRYASSNFVHLDSGPIREWGR
jgi:uncharacterized protein YcbK (DUF882 family)